MAASESDAEVNIDRLRELAEGWRAEAEVLRKSPRLVVEAGRKLAS